MATTLSIAFLAGLVSFLSPCVLPLIPGYISYISGQTLNDIVTSRQRILIKTILFSLGFSAVFISFGATASLIGKSFLKNSNELRWIAGLIVVLFSLHIMGFLNLKFIDKELRWLRTLEFSKDLGFPFVIGLAFGFGWTPCIGPILGSILVLAAVETTISEGVMLLSSYSLGLAIPFILSGYSISRFLRISKKLRNKMRLISITGGIILLFTGIAIMTNQLQFLGYFILEYFPFLGNIG